MHVAEPSTVSGVLCKRYRGVAVYLVAGALRDAAQQEIAIFLPGDFWEHLNTEDIKQHYSGELWGGLIEFTTNIKITHF